ncbi:MAG: response regulator [Actinobacteria bacterium]|nr:response regulator [Actinomycetota bacterium]
MVIEDDRSIARLAEIILNGKGLQTHLCLDATNAVQIAQRVHPDLIILDIHMPRRSGISILKRLQQDESTRVIPVIVNSVLTRRQSIDQLKKMGASDFVPKGAGIDALVDRVLFHLEPE